jgi:hypothetical protein
MFGKNAPSTVLMNDPDQDRIHADLATFFGPRADRYLKVYERLRPKQVGLSQSSFGMWRNWNWAAFFGSFVWFFYRKQYLVGAAVVLIPLVLSLFLGAAGTSGIAVAIALSANPVYVTMALRRISKADKLGLHGAERTQYLRRAGGVSLVAGLLAGILYAALFALMIFAVVGNRESIH